MHEQESENQYILMQNNQEIQLKRQRNMDKYNLKIDNCSSTHTAMSGGKIQTVGAGVADFIESGSNYGKLNVSNYKIQSKGDRPWRKFKNQPKKISEIIDDTSMLTKSLTALNSKVNNQKESKGQEDQSDLVNSRMEKNMAVMNFQNYADIEDGVLAECEDDDQVPNESSEEDNGETFPGSRVQPSGMTYLVRQCKLKRHRFTFLGQQAHTMANHGGKIEAPKAFRSTIENMNYRHSERDEVDSVRSHSSETKPYQSNYLYSQRSPRQTIKLAKSQCKVQRPMMSILGQYVNSETRALSPRSDSRSKDDEIESIHSDEDDIYINRVQDKQNHMKKEKVRPSDETIFLSSQDLDSHRRLDIPDEDERQKSITRQQNKAMQTSIQIQRDNHGNNQQIPLLKTLLQGHVNLAQPNSQNVTNQGLMKMVNMRNQWPTTRHNTYETKSNIGTCEVLPLQHQLSDNRAKMMSNQLEMDQQKYLNHLNQKKEQPEDEQDFKFLANFMKTTQIKCYKYNSSLNTQTGQNQTVFDAMITLSNDGQSLIITNSRPVKVRKLDEFIDNQSQTDTSDDQEQSETAANNPDDLQPQQIFKELDRQAEQDIRMKEMLQRQDTTKLVQSSATCKISEIKSFNYGGFSSRFWLLRKHINSMSKKDLVDIPFHSWNCITMHLGRRDVNLVIKDENNMKLFIKFLVYSLCTLDGRRDSAKPLLNQLISSEIEKIKRQTGKTWVRQAHENKVEIMHQNKLFNAVAYKYKVMKIRAKIGFMALEKGLTIQEVILHAIYKTYVHYIDDYKINPNEQYIHADSLYQSIISFERNLKQIALMQKDNELSMIHHGHTNSNMSQFGPNHSRDPSVMSEKIKIEKLTDFKNNLKKSWQMVLDPSMGNPYRKLDDQQTKNPELYTKDQIRKKKLEKNEKPNHKKTNSVNRPSADQIQEIIRKDKCVEIFKDVMVDQAESLFSNQNIAMFVASKFKNKINEIRFAQLNIFINMRLIRGPRYIEAILARIRLSREIFLIELQQGLEALIPYDLSHDHLPQSFRYYDFILRFIQESVSQDRRDFQKIKMKLSRLFDSKLSLTETFGIGNFLKKLKNKKKGIQQKNEDDKQDEIDYQKSVHTKQVQRSRYLLLDDDRNDQSDHEDQIQIERHQRPLQEILGIVDHQVTPDSDQEEEEIKNDENIKPSKFKLQPNHSCNTIAVKYLKAEQVLERRKQGTSIKFHFQNTINTLKQKGHFLEQIHVINQWIQNNHEHLFEMELQRRKQLDPSKYSKLTPEQEAKEFLQYRRELAERAEIMVLRHREGVKRNKYEKFHSRLQNEKKEDDKLRILDDFIEEDILYFNAKAGDQKSRAISTIKAQLRKKLKKLQNKDLQINASARSLTPNNQLQRSMQTNKQSNLYVTSSKKKNDNMMNQTIGSRNSQLRVKSSRISKASKK